MTRLPLCIGLAVTLAAAAPVFAAPAQNPPQPATGQSAAAARGSARVKAGSTPALPTPGSRNCLRHTGSLFPAAQGRCLPVAGSSYSREDLERTGATNIGRALQMLDPSVTLGR